MNTSPSRLKYSLWLLILMILAPMVNACQSQVVAMAPASTPLSPEINQQEGEQAAALPVPTLTERPIYNPGELVDYIAQTGDTLPNLAVRFNTTEQEIR